MVVYITIDDNNGLMFNNRRQSQDRIMRENMLKHCGEAKLWIAEYSRKLFIPQDGSEFPSNVIVDDDFRNKADYADHCFVEKDNLAQWMDKIDTLVIYKWNRNYPTDLCFDFSVLDSGWKRFSVSDFQGSSHDKITREVWKRA
jgi:hypothetical protein